MNATHNLRICFMILFLLCNSRGGDLWAQNESDVSRDSLSKTRELTAQDSILENQLRAIHLPLIIITTNDRVEPPYSVMETPEGFAGKTITENPYVPARCVMLLDGDTLYDSDEYVEDVSGCRIRVRGNTTAVYGGETPPFKLKFSKKVDLLFRGDKSLKDKNWVLLNFFASDMFNTLAGNTIAAYVRDAWQPSTQYVNVIVNGVSRGVYILSESIKGGDHRIPVSTSGFITEIDVYYWADLDAPHIFSNIIKNIAYTFKYPDEDEFTEERLDTIADFLHKVEQNLLEGTNISDVLDVPSFAVWLLSHDILGTSDPAGSNIFMVKNSMDAEDDRLSAGPLWDFTDCMRTDYFDGGWSWVHTPYNGGCYIRWLVDQPEFILAFAERWNEIKDDLFNVVEMPLKQTAAEWGMGLDESYRLAGKDITTGQLIKHVADWLMERIPWLDENIGEMVQTRLPQSVVASQTRIFDHTEIYDLQGKLLSVRPYAFKPSRSNGFAPGCYILRRIGTDGKTLDNKKVIVK